MKYIFAFLLFTSTALAAQHSVDFSWKLPETDGLPLCSSTIVSSCIVGTNLYLVAGSALTQLNLLPIPVPPGTTGTTLLVYTIGPWANIGSNTAVATMLFKDNSGAQKETGQSNAYTFQSVILPPGNLVAIPH